MKMRPIVNVDPREQWTNEQYIEFVKSFSGPKVGVLAGGGDSPGANAVLQGIIDGAEDATPRYLLVPFQDGFWGIVQEPPILSSELWTPPQDLVSKGGVIIGSSRINPEKVMFDASGRMVEKKNYKMREENRMAYIGRNIALLGLVGIIYIGGDNTLGAAHRLSQLGYNAVGVPKSIDDDYGDAYAFGRHTAVERGVKTIDDLVSHANSHSRDIVLEVMGRHCGRIALEIGIAVGALNILLPEFKYDFNVAAQKSLEDRRRGARYNIHIVAEGAKAKNEETEISANAETDGYNEKILGGAGKRYADRLSVFYRKHGVGYAIRFSDDVVRDDKEGHGHRSGNPCETDRVRGYKYGLAAMQLVVAELWGFMPGYRKGEYKPAPLQNATVKKRVTAEEYDCERLQPSRKVLQLS